LVTPLILEVIKRFLGNADTLSLQVQQIYDFIELSRTISVRLTRWSRPWCKLQAKPEHKDPHGEANLEASLLEPLKKRGDRNWEELDPSCPVYKNEPLHAIMDRSSRS
uniref:Uncharacterized protein n=1 Tax=Parascaris equorum TaxID=6256 RepID=A0A914RZY1_PAREQ